MSDLTDRAQERSEEFLEDALTARALQSKREELIPNGKCAYCFEEINKKAHNPRFCDVVCRDSYERVQRILRNRG